MGFTGSFLTSGTTAGGGTSAGSCLTGSLGGGVIEAGADSLGMTWTSGLSGQLGGMLGSPEFLHMTDNEGAHPPFSRCAALMLIYMFMHISTTQTTSGGIGTGTSGFAICVAFAYILFSVCAVSVWFGLLFYTLSENGFRSPLYFPSGFQKIGSNRTKARPYCTGKDKNRNQM